MRLSLRLVRELSAAEIGFLRRNLNVDETKYPRTVYDWKRTARDGLAVVAFYGDELAGIALAYPDNGNILVGEIAVAKNLRRMGIGRKILKFLVRIAKNRGADEVYLGAQDGAAGFYRSLGWWEYTYVGELSRGAPLKINAAPGWVVAGGYNGIQRFFRKPLRPSLEVRREAHGYKILRNTHSLFAETWNSVVEHILPNLYELDYILPFYRQKKGSVNCGPVCAKIALEFFGKPLSVPELLRFIPVKDGTWAPWMYKGLTDLGMDVDVWVFNPPRNYARELRMIRSEHLHRNLLATRDLRQLLIDGYLLIISVNQRVLYGGGVEGHYVVVRGFKGRKFYIVDPTFTSRSGAHLVEGWRILRAIYSAKFGGEVIALRPEID
ncbi:MAG: GNAT family N-acetyltransferase [Candidatus Diapherotrites archaeon]|nr:GNAT family N-acetyltransferase [Candidatus Diapherotrites archaeon]